MLFFYTSKIKIYESLMRPMTALAYNDILGTTAYNGASWHIKTEETNDVSKDDQLLAEVQRYRPHGSI